MLQRSSSNPTGRKHFTIKPAQKVYITSSLTDHFLHCELVHSFLIVYTEECLLSSYNLFNSQNMQQVIKRSNKTTSYQLFNHFWRNLPQQKLLMWSIYPASRKSFIFGILSMQCNSDFLCRDNFQPLGTFLLIYHLQVQYARNWT